MALDCQGRCLQQRGDSTINPSMISDFEIEQKSRELDVSPQHVERDYVHGWLLKEIYSHHALAKLLVLKGGNGIRKGYLPGTRYSKDLDFSCAVEVEEERLLAELEGVIRAAGVGSGVQFCLDRTRVAQKRLNIAGVRAVEARIYFKGFYGEERVILRSHLDINEFEKTYLPVQSRSLLHPYSDSTSCAGQIRCHKLEEILASKLTTLLFRHKAQDLFDLVYSIFFASEFPVSRAEVIRTFLKKSIYDPEARQARSQLLALPFQIFRTLWSDLVMPVSSRYEFDVAQSRFAQLIEELFGLLEPALAGGARISGQPIARSFGYGGSFVAAARHIIIEAGRARRMIEADYHGIRRLIEPYKLEFKVRKKDNRGFEYFYGWDRTGGRASPPGIKSFFSDELRAISMTDLPFTPRYQVEF
jgi:predicted nucleotidyltransferase component of viral defense system